LAIELDEMVEILGESGSTARQRRPDGPGVVSNDLEIQQ
jgi:hypothetical protein